MRPNLGTCQLPFQTKTKAALRSKWFCTRVLLPLIQSQNTPHLTHKFLQNHVNYVPHYFLLNCACFPDQYLDKYTVKLTFLWWKQKVSVLMARFPVHEENGVNPIAMRKNSRHSCVPAWRVESPNWSPPPPDPRGRNAASRQALGRAEGSGGVHRNLSTENFAVLVKCGVNPKRPGLSWT